MTTHLTKRQADGIVRMAAVYPEQYRRDNVHLIERARNTLTRLGLNPEEIMQEAREGEASLRGIVKALPGAAALLVVGWVLACGWMVL